MKAFVIKNKEGKYFARYIATRYNDSDYVEFGTLDDAEMYEKRIGAENTKEFIEKNEYRFHIKDCEVVEITIAEGDLEKQLVEKDKEIKQLKLNYEYQKKVRAEQDKEWSERFEKVCDELERVKKAKNDGLIEVLLKDQRHQICEEIREKAEYKNWSKVVPFVYVIKPELLDQIEKGE